MVDGPWYLRNDKIHTDLEMDTVSQRNSKLAKGPRKTTIQSLKHLELFGTFDVTNAPLMSIPTH